MRSRQRLNWRIFALGYSLIGTLKPSLIEQCRYKKGHSQVIKVIGTNMVCRYTQQTGSVTRRLKQLNYKGNCSGPNSRVGTLRMSLHRGGSVQASFTVFGCLA